MNLKLKDSGLFKVFSHVPCPPSSYGTTSIENINRSVEAFNKFIVNRNETTQEPSKKVDA